MVMPRAVEPGHAEGGGADPEEAAVGDGVHWRSDVPCVAYSEHVIEQAHDEEGRESSRVGVREVVCCNEETCPVA